MAITLQVFIHFAVDLGSSEPVILQTTNTDLMLAIVEENQEATTSI